MAAFVALCATGTSGDFTGALLFFARNCFLLSCVLYCGCLFIYGVLYLSNGDLFAVVSLGFAGETLLPVLSCPFIAFVSLRGILSCL